MNSPRKYWFCLPSSFLIRLRTGIAQRYSAWLRAGWSVGGCWGFESRQDLRIFLFTISSRSALGPTPLPIQWVPGALSLGVERPGREDDHSHHLVPRSRMRGAIPPLPQYTLMAWCSAKKGTVTALPLFYRYLSYTTVTVTMLLCMITAISLIMKHEVTCS
jgi:hypothetical protein